MGSPSRSLEMGRPFQTFSRLATDRSLVYLGVYQFFSIPALALK
jgi:hypothetical protein